MQHMQNWRQMWIMNHQSFSPEPITEDQEAEDEAWSFSPELLHGDENEEAIGTEQERAMLVIFQSMIFNRDLMLKWWLRRI